MSPPLRARVTYHTAGPQTETPFAAENLSAPLAFASCSAPLDDVQAAGAVDQVHEAAAVVADVVAAGAGGAVRNRRDEAGDLARSVRLADVHDPEAVGEPGHRDLGPAHFLGRLVAAGELGLRRAVDAVDLEARERRWPRLVGDVHEPEERRRGVLGEAQHVLVRDQHDR